MRSNDWVKTRLLAWGWHWADKRAREGDSVSLIGTLGRDGVGGGTPGPRIPIHPRDWMRPDVANTDAAYETLNEPHRDVIWAHFVESEVPVKIHCATLGIGTSLYYQRLHYAIRNIGIVMRRGVDMENVHMEPKGLVQAKSA